MVFGALIQCERNKIKTRKVNQTFYSWKTLSSSKIYSSSHQDRLSFFLNLHKSYIILWFQSSTSLKDNKNKPTD